MSRYLTSGGRLRPVSQMFLKKSIRKNNSRKFIIVILYHQQQILDLMYFTFMCQIPGNFAVTSWATLSENLTGVLQTFIGEL
jgi:hypothetical protein